MIIRAYKPEDFQGVVDLLIKADVEPPAEESDLKGICIVAEEKDSIVGVIWALTGLSSQAYIDYFAVDIEYQKTRLAWNLVKVMDKLLMARDIHRYNFYIEPDNKYFIDLVKKYKSNKVTELRDLKFFRREIGDGNENL